MRIGVLTGGGDVPGLNPCIKAIVERAETNGWEVVGIRLGWGGLLNYNLDDESDKDTWTKPLTRLNVRTIDRYGGTHLHTSRTNPQKVSPKMLPAFLKDAYPFAEGQATVDCTPHVLRVLEHLGINAMIPIGGDDTLSYGARLFQEGVPVVACPKTMDNDVFGTDYCIGFGTAVTRTVDMVNDLRTPTGSHERIAVIEMFGRNSGETALISGYLSYADRVLISEVPFNLERLAEMIIKDRERNPSNYAVVVVSEGAMIEGGDVMETGEADAFGHRKLGGIGEVVGDELKRLTKIDVVKQNLAYLMRAGAPDSLDRMVGGSYGLMAVQQLEQGHSGLMMALQNGTYTTVPADICIQGLKRVDVDELYDVEEYKPRINRMLGKPMFLY